MALLIVVFGFFFVTVSSRIVGIIGSSSNPISGMTIATLMATCLVFVALRLDGRRATSRWRSGRRDRVHRRGQRRRDLAGPEDRLPRRRDARQPADRPHHRRRSSRPSSSAAPSSSSTSSTRRASCTASARRRCRRRRRTLMATIIKGLLAQKLPWGPVLVGVFLAFMAQLAGAHALSWAVGAYLPLSTTAPIWIGGLMKGVSADAQAQGGTARSRRRRPRHALRHRASSPAARSPASPSRCSSASAATWRTCSTSAKATSSRIGFGGDVIGFGMFALLCVLLIRQARAKDA